MCSAGLYWLSHAVTAAEAMVKYGGGAGRATDQPPEAFFMSSSGATREVTGLSAPPAEQLAERLALAPYKALTLTLPFVGPGAPGL